jgi:hypothetical protein
MTDLVAQQLLVALFEMSRDTRRISAGTLGKAVGITPARAALALLTLERAGLVDAARARLTMRGLVAAARSGQLSASPACPMTHPYGRPRAPLQWAPWAAGTTVQAGSENLLVL